MDPPPLDMDEPLLLLEGGVYVLPEFELPLSVRRLCGCVVGRDEPERSVVLGLVTVPLFVGCLRPLVEFLTSVVGLLPSDTVLPLREELTEPLELSLFPREVPTRFEVLEPSVPLRLDTLERVSIRPFASRLIVVDPRLLEDVAPTSLRLELPVLELKRSRLSERTEE